MKPQTSLMISAAMAVALFSPAAMAQDTPREVVEAYVDTVINGREFDRIGEFVHPDIIQHNPNLPNGREALQAFWTEFMTSQPEAEFIIARTVAEGDLVAKHAWFVPAPGELGAAVIDIYRVEDGLIVQHWDAVQFIPEETVSGNHMVLDVE